MMALFMMLWIVGQQQHVKQQVAQYFRHPGVFDTTPGSLLPETTPLIPNTLEQEPVAATDAMASLHAAHPWHPQELLLGHLKARLQSLLVTLPELTQLQKQIAEVSRTATDGSGLGGWQAMHARASAYAVVAEEKAWAADRRPGCAYDSTRRCRRSLAGQSRWKNVPRG
jgi:hypothetical protein